MTQPETSPTVYTIDPGSPFVDALASGILKRIGRDPLKLASCTVLLPTRRACRALREAFLRLTGGEPLLLPRMSPLGDIDADELALTLEELPGGSELFDLPPALEPLKRQLLLTRLVQATGLTPTAAQAARLAAELARLRDTMIDEGLDLDRLDGLVPEDHAQHWQITLNFLKILREHWPRIEEEVGAIDAAARRNLVLKAQARLWRERPPEHPVIAAGSTGSIKATAELLAVVASLPQGAVVLPGLDLNLDEASWLALDEAHPQYGLARLLEKLGVVRAEIRVWEGGPTSAPPARTRLLAEALRPAATTEAWRDLSGIGEEALEGITRIDCPSPQEEAGAIALLMRHALETPEKTVALVTPDRGLARRVATALERWGIAVDDSGGRPLRDTAVGTFLRHVADGVLANAEPVALLTLLKHPLAAGGMDPARFRALARLLERAVLRGPRPGPGFAGLLAALEQAPRQKFDHAGEREELADWLRGLERMMAPWLEALADGRARPLSEWLNRHGELAEALAATHREIGPERLWRHEDGEMAAEFLNELMRAAADFPELPGSQYPALLEALMASRVVRPRWGRHPRLSILGLLEARLQRADLVILAGLNEGTWPPDAAADPWLSRPMRKMLALPTPERRIGLAAHDFAQLANAPRVVLTRSERVDGTPTVPSRWLLRLDTVLTGLDLDGRLEAGGEPWLHWAAYLDEPDAVRPVSAPEPRPPVSARPRKLSVTRIETWMRDPYAIYARYVLGLEALDPIAADPGAAERGQFIHAALDAFIREYPDALPADAVERLLALGEKAFGDHLAQPDVWAFWWPRFERVAHWFVERERARRNANIRTVRTETKGRLDLDGPGGSFTLTATADRIDLLPDGSLGILDYKTGTPPSTKEVELGFAPQLPLEAAIAQAGGFQGLEARPVSELAFWKLSGGDPPGEEKALDPAELPRLVEEARQGLLDLIRTFDDPATPYRALPRPDHAPRYSDYAHLARVPEWSAAGGDGGE